MIRILPNDKSDLEACANLALADDELIEPHIKELFIWLQDMSWPVAKKISVRLSALGMELVPELRHILNSDNNLWKYSIVSDFLYGVSNEVYDALFFNLKHIQKHPTTGERKAQVNLKVDRLINSRKPQPHIIREPDVDSTIVGFSRDTAPLKTTLFDNSLKNPSSSSSFSSPPSVNPSLIRDRPCQFLTTAQESVKVISIDGNNFNTLEEFFLEVESQFSLDSCWNKNLDGFNEVLQHYLEKYPAGYTLKWKNSKVSKKHLSYDETIRQLQKRLEGCHPNQKKIVTDAIDRAKSEEGATVFDWLVTIIEYQNLASKFEVSGKIQINLV